MKTGVETNSISKSTSQSVLDYKLYQGNQTSIDGVSSTQTPTTKLPSALICYNCFQGFEKHNSHFLFTENTCSVAEQFYSSKPMPTHFFLHTDIQEVNTGHSTKLQHPSQGN